MALTTLEAALANRRADAFVVALASCAALIGGLAVIGYAWHLPALIRPLADTPAICLAVAVAMLAGGIALVFEGIGRPSAPGSILFGASIALVGVVGAIENLAGVSLGIDAPALHRALGLTGATPGRPVPAICGCLILVGGALVALPRTSDRRISFAVDVAAVAAPLLGALALAGYHAHGAFSLPRPLESPMPPPAAFALVLLGLGLWRALLLRGRATARPDAHDEGRRIFLTAVWVLSLIAVVAGISTFALAQYEYQNAAHDNVARMSRERRAFLEYAIRQHIEQVSFAATRPLPAVLAASGRRAGTLAERQAALTASAESFAKAGFSGWRYELDGYPPISFGTFIADSKLTVPLISAYHTEIIWKDGYFLRTRIPIRDDKGQIGFAVAEEAFPELTRLTLEADAWGDTGEMALCSAVVNELICFPHRSNSLGSRNLRKIREMPVPMTLALDHEIGVREILDYRNHRVLAAYGPVGFTGLGMVIKMDAAELNQPLGKRFGYAMLLLFALVAAGVLLLRRRLEPLTKALQNAREEASRVAMQFKSAAESSLDAYFIMDAVRNRNNAIDDFRVRYLNASGEVLIGRPSEDVVGRTLGEVLPAKQAAFFLERYRRIVTTGEALSEEFRTTGGDVAASWVAHQAVKLGDGVSVTARDISEQKVIEAQLRTRAENDVLTGLPNRTLFFERLEQTMARARRDRVGVGVLFLDIDHFKQVNDTNGHAAGDAVLIEFAARLRRSIRATDTVARLSGDEFAILLSEVDNIGSAEAVAAHIVDAIRVPFDIGGKPLHVGTSIGVGFSPRGLESAQSLVARADRKLYQAKGAGRGRFSSASQARAA
jgi:diguanylate cyclase (GGDEF)-like protein/PAS domain S-box-containing protein